LRTVAATVPLSWPPLLCPYFLYHISYCNAILTSSTFELFVLSVQSRLSAVSVRSVP
jgi:hypothetical protein